MSTPVITVLITTFNYGRFIEECLDSVLAQEYPPDKIDIVVVDDGSTDDTAERVKRYGNKVRYFSKPNGGQASALNLGFAQARGEIISLLDADDYFLPGKLARVVEAFQRDTTVGMVYHPLLGVSQNGEKQMSRYPLLSGSPFSDPDKFFWYEAPGTCASYRREILARLLPIPEQIQMLADDYPGCLIVFLAPVSAVPQCLAAYRVHGSNSFQVDERNVPTEVRSRKLQTWEVVTEAKKKWLLDNGLMRESRVVKPMLQRWQLHLEAQQILIESPSRMRLFRHLLLYNRCYGPHLPRKLRMMNQVNPWGVLVLGHRHFGLLECWKKASTSLKRAVGGPTGKREIGRTL